MLRFVFDLDIPLLAGRVPFQRTAYELVRRCSGAEIPEGMLKDQVRFLNSRQQHVVLCNVFVRRRQRRGDG